MPLDSDCAAALENMLIAADSLGIGSCWIFYVLLAFSSPQGPELRKILQIPEGYRPYCTAVFGYKASDGRKAAERKPGLVTYVR